MIKLTHQSTYPAKNSADEVIRCQSPYKLVRVITDPHHEGIRHWVISQDSKGLTLHWEVSDPAQAEGWEGSFEVIVQDAEVDPAPVVLIPAADRSTEEAA